MTNLKKKLWYIFPALSFISWLIFAGYFTDLLPYSLDSLILVSFPFYLGAALLTIPLNIFTLIAIILGIKCKRKKESECKTYFIAGILNLLISIIWAVSIFGFNWILTA